MPNDAVLSAPSATTFLWSWRRFVVAWLLLGLFGEAVAMAALFVAFALASGHFAAPPAALLGQIPLYPVAFAGAGLLFNRRRPPWLRTSDAGLEIAATATDPVFVPWSAIASARLHGFGPLKSLHVTPTDPALALRAHRNGRPPRQRHGAGPVTFIADIGSLRPDPRAIRAELLRHGCPIEP